MVKEDKTETKNTDLETVLEAVQSLAGSLDDTNKRIDTLQSTKRADEERDDTGTAVQSGVDSDILAVVHELLGNRFTVTTEQNTVGQNFMLKIVAPEELADNTDKTPHAMAISNTDGINGVRLYVQRVQKFLMGRAASRGISWDKWNNA